MTDFASPKMYLVQVGNARVPSMAQELTDFNFEVKQALSEMHNGGQYDHDYNRRSVLNRVQASLTGIYPECCHRGKCNCDYATHESDGVRCQLGVRAPFLFYRDYSHTPSKHKPKTRGSSYETELDPECEDCGCVDVMPDGYDENCCGDCSPLGDCGRWLWAWGKITAIDESSNLEEDYKAPKGVRFSFDFELEGPLCAASFFTWSYGPPKAQTIIDWSQTETEALLSEPESAWWLPCKWNGCCDVYRFTWRGGEAQSNAAYFQPSEWDAKRSQSSGKFKLVVGGNYQPRLRMLVTGTTSVKIKNDFWSREYVFPISAGSRVYYDSANGKSLLEDSNGAITPFYGLCENPTVECGVNVIEITGGSVQFGISERWV